MGKMKTSKRSIKAGIRRPQNKKPGGFKSKSKFGPRKDKEGAPAPAPEPKISTPDVKNPFEIRVNKKKHNVLGNFSKNDKGLPGISRAKAIEKRKATLLPEFLQRNKSNRFMDKRIGEKDAKLTEEDKAMRRVQMEKRKQYKKKSIFSLGDEDEILTHKGQTLDSLSRYEDPRDLDDSEDELLSDMFVSNANFGGFMKIKEKTEGQEEEPGEDGKKTRDQIIAELVLASKVRKMQKAKENDENFEKIQNLDEAFRSDDFRSLINQLQVPQKVKPKTDDLNEEQLLALVRGEKSEIPKKKVEETPPVPKAAEEKPSVKPKEPESAESDYDKLVKELQFESKKARPGDIPRNDDQQRQDEREAFSTKLSSLEDLSGDEKVKLEELFEEVLEAKSGEKLKLPEALSTMLEFFLETVEVQDDTSSGSAFQLFSDKYDSYHNLLVPEIYAVMRLNAVGCTKRFLQHLIQAREDCFTKPSPLISTQLIVLLQLTSRLFPLDDIRHAVLVPALNTLSKCIYEGKCNTPKSLYRILTCCRIFYEIVESTKRFSPEVVHFLFSVMLCYCPNSASVINETVPNVRKARTLLHAAKKCNPVQESVMLVTLELLAAFVRMYEYLPSSVEMFLHWKSTLETLAVKEALPSKCKNSLNSLVELITNLKAGKQFLRIAAAKPKPLKLYEPQIDDDFGGGGRRKKLPRQKQEEARLKHKIKEETKSAVREIKKDNYFLATQQLKQQMASDAERKRKVKELLGSLANQEGDYQRIKRGK